MLVRWLHSRLLLLSWKPGLASLTAAALVAPAPVDAQLAAPPLASSSAPLVFRGVTVIDVRDGRRAPNQVVTIVGNRIQAITPLAQARVTPGARVVEAAGKFLIPGLWDMHVHPKEYADLAYPLYIANGITGVRDAGSNVPLATLSRWKQEISAGTRAGPRLLVSGPAVSERLPGSTRGDAPDPYEHMIAVPKAEARRVVDSLKAAGADMIKFYNMSPEMRATMAAEARRIGIPFGGHSEDTPGQVFSDSGALFLDHFTWFEPNPCDDTGPNFDLAKCADAVERLRHNNTWITGTNVNWPVSWIRRFALVMRYRPDSLPGHTALLERLQKEPLVQGDARRLDSLAAAQQPTSTDEWIRLFMAEKEGKRGLDAMLRKSRLRAAGIRFPIVAATDGESRTGSTANQAEFGKFSIVAFTLPEMLVSYVIEGMTPLEALQTATLNPALALRATDSLGTIEVGKVADLVLLDADPLIDIWYTTRLRGVVANGRYYDRAALDTLLAAAESVARRAPPPALRRRMKP